ncbi:hypothetical protein GWO43_12405 [candidate division KSB1 bacterium]|nr:hypothetical protein [candidate division KSB1 bacterium]NIR71054.1 hypothetical protein [candidate division KSB1 bacterium]NIS24758.1 hypothetical protein [candidate division KSB1 bacterium]NIT71663.1 hypothetical protein [candidate division KSB1 bacterium]NIU25370.1 hypothetical protein [candidate division KSB1 bacterium]
MITALEFLKSSANNFDFHWEFIMQSTAIKKMELKQKIAQLPEKKLAEVESFLKRLLSKEIEPKKPINLKGIWENKGFENISDLDSELKSIRRELEESILKKRTEV